MTDWEEDHDWDTAEFDDDEADTITCKNCHKEFYEDSVCCPYCGEYAVRDLSPWADKPQWLVTFYRLIVLCLILSMLGSGLYLLLGWLF
jgi:hypothetical protein